MQRAIRRLESEIFDLLVIGGGIHGAAIAREAATRGLSTALVEQADFCSGTSANSLKIMHGGLRYLQQADVPRLLQSVRERAILLRSAPHLVRPMPCIMPTRGLGMKSRPALALGMLANDILSATRNRGLPSSRHIPNGGTFSREECLRLLPWFKDSGVTGGARWYDALALDTERLAIALLKSADAAGAALANYTKAETFIVEQGRVTGVTVRDALDGRTFPVQARTVVNAAGPWSPELLGGIARPLPPGVNLSLAINLVVRNWPVTESAVGLQSAVNPRLFFFVPWRGATMAGTYYRAHTGPLSEMRVTEADITSYLEMINSCLPGVRLTHDDILTVQAGILPTQGAFQEGGEPVMLRHFQLTDHGTEGGPAGLYSVLGVKYTTARAAAEIVIDAIARRSGLPVGPSVTRQAPMMGGDTPDAARLPAGLRAALPSISDKDAERLATLYGTEAAAIVKRAQDGGTPASGANALLLAEIGFVLDDEMPQSLGDLLFRRMGTASAGRPDAQHVRDCAHIMGSACGWNREREAREVDAVLAAPHLWQAGCLFGQC